MQGMQRTTVHLAIWQVFKQMRGETGRQAELTRRLEALLAAREREAGQLRQDCAAARARLIEVSAENHALKGQVRGALMHSAPGTMACMHISCARPCRTDRVGCT